MSRVSINFIATDSMGNEHAIAHAALPFVPRKGERVVLENLRYACDRHKDIDDQKFAEETDFTVARVSYRLEAFDTADAPTEDYVCDVYVVPEGKTWEGLELSDTH